MVLCETLSPIFTSGIIGVGSGLGVGVGVGSGVDGICPLTTHPTFCVVPSV